MIKNYFKKIFKQQPLRKSNNFLDFGINDYKSFNDSYIGVEAYRKNVIVFRCVNIIAQSASHVPWVVTKKCKNTFTVVRDHPAYMLLKRPSPEKPGADFFSEVIAAKLLYGNAYILIVSNENKHQKELYLLPSSSVDIVLNKNYPVAYKYRSTNGEKVYSIDPLTRISKVLQIKSYNPNNSHYGLSHLESAKQQINLHTQATNWNYSLLKNGARPTGALVMKDNNGYFTEDQLERLNEQLQRNFTGSENSGKPLILEGGLSW